MKFGLIVAACVTFMGNGAAVTSHTRALIQGSPYNEVVRDCPAGSYMKKQTYLADYCVKCKGCGLYTDSRNNQTECKQATVETCPKGTVPINAEGASSLEQACQRVDRGKYYEEKDGCYAVSPCKGPALYTDTSGQSKCKDFSSTCKAHGLQPRFVYQGFKPSAEDLCIDKENATEFATHSDGLFRICSGCGSYAENGECKTATRATCPEGKVPVVTVGATSLEDACATLPDSDFGYDQEQCAILPCAKRKVDLKSFHPTCQSALNAFSLSPTSTCSDIVTTKTYANGKMHTLKLLGKVLGILKLDTVCENAQLQAANPQCACPSTPPTTTPQPTTATTSGGDTTTTTTTNSQAPQQQTPTALGSNNSGSTHITALLLSNVLLALHLF
jgi:hypothetical protein